MHQTGLVENIQAFVDEYQTARHLTPIKIMIHGPPFSGKSTLALRLATFYNLHYCNVEHLMRETVRKLVCGRCGV